jgi:SPP1 gp7 family putative phage head morphogenesis protein
MGMSIEMACRMNKITISEQDLKANPWLKEKPEKVSPINFAGAGNANGEQKPKLPPPEKLLTIGKSMKTMDYDSRRKYQDDYQDKVHIPLEKIYHEKITRFFIGQRNRMQDRVDIWLAKNTRKTMKAADDPQLDQFLLDKEKEDKRANDVIQQLMAQQINVGMNRLDEEMGGIDWGKVDPLSHKYSLIERVAMEDINTTTFTVARDKIGEAIGQAVDDNLTAQEAAKLIKESIADVIDIRRNQAMTIARTETGKIQSGLRFDVYRDEGIEYTMWTTANDEKVRDSHMMADGEVRRIDTPFSMGLLYPLQSGGPAEEIINCRCIGILTDNPNQ